MTYPGFSLWLNCGQRIPCSDPITRIGQIQGGLELCLGEPIMRVPPSSEFYSFTTSWAW